MKNEKETILFWQNKEWMALYFAWAIALFGFCLSVFFGEVLQHEPCPLCWYQRIALFPLVLLLGIAAYRNDLNIVSYALPLSLLGALTALFQISEKYFPILQKAGVCNLGDTCSQSVFTLFGFLDLPTVSFIGFLLISGLLFVCRQK